MKKTLFATAFAVATMACAPAFAQATGFVGVSAAHGEIDTPFGNGDGESFDVHGALSAPLGESLSAQFSASYSDSNDADGVFSGQAHLVGDFGGTRVGGFVAAAEVANETAVGGGAELQANLSQVSLVGTVAYATVDNVDVDVWGVSGEARFFASDDFRVDGSLGWLTLDTPLGDVEAWTAGIGGEYQFANNVSLFGGYTYVDVNDVDVSANIFSVGVRYNWGGSLRERNDNGASFGGVGGLLSSASVAGF